MPQLHVATKRPVFGFKESLMRFGIKRSPSPGAATLTSPVVEPLLAEPRNAALSRLKEIEVSAGDYRQLVGRGVGFIGDCALERRLRLRLRRRMLSGALV